MSQALELRPPKGTVTVTFGADQLPIPKGCTALQVKVAARMLTFDPERDSFYGIMREVGYSEATALASARRTLESAGVQRATRDLVARQVDRANGLVGFGMQLVAGANIDELSSRDKVFLGLDAVKKGFELGENQEQRGDGDAWRRARSKLVAIAFRRGYRCAKLGRPLPTRCCGFPPTEITSTEIARRINDPS